MEKKLSYSIPEVSRETGLGKTTVYKAISDGHLRAKKFGNRTLILSIDLDQFLNSLPEINCTANLPIRGVENHDH